jgi:hypothetical protein
MENSIMCEGFHASEAMHGVRFHQFVGKQHYCFTHKFVRDLRRFTYLSSFQFQLTEMQVCMPN